MRTSGEKKPRINGVSPNGPVIAKEIFKRGWSFTAVGHQFESVLENDAFRREHPELFSGNRPPSLSVTTLGELIRGERNDRRHLTVLAWLFGYDSYRALALNRSLHPIPDGTSQMVRMILVDWLQRIRPAPHEPLDEECVLERLLTHFREGKLSHIHPELARIDVTHRRLRQGVTELEQTGLVALRDGRYVVVDEPIANLIKSVRQRCWVLQRCIAAAYDPDFGSQAHRRHLATLLDDPLKKLRRANDQSFTKSDALCQIVLAAGDLSLHQHVEVELLHFDSALDLVFFRRRNYPRARYSRNYNYGTYEAWYQTFSRVNLAKWEMIANLLKLGTAKQADICREIKQMTDLTSLNLKAIYHSEAAPLGRASENRRFAKLKPMEEL